MPRKTIHRKEGVKILEKFFQLDVDMDKLCAYYQLQNYSKEQITEFMKTKFKEIILEIQYELFRSGKIKELKMFDNSSEEMFDQLIYNLNRYFPKKFGYDFVFEEKCKQLKVQKSTTSKKFQLYSLFLDYAASNDLFKYIVVKSQSKVMKKQHIDNPQKLYEPHELELICLYYEIYDGVEEQMQLKFKERGFDQEKFLTKNLKRNIQNLQLIGLFKCYLKSIKSRNGKGVDWEKFIQDDQEHFQMIDQWDPNLKLVLIKIAIRSEVKSQQIRFVCRKMGRRYEDKPFVDMIEPPPKGKNEIYCQSPEMDKLRQELVAVIKTKIWFNNLATTNL